MKTWVKDPDAGGVKVPRPVQERTRQRILAHAEKRYQGRYRRLDIRFRGVFCYIDAYLEPDVPRNWPPKDWGVSRKDYLERLRQTPIHLCRMRYFGDEDAWSLAYFTYSNETYQLAAFFNGSFYGTPEEAFDIGAMNHLPR